jgi:hypothetical protein
VEGYIGSVGDEATGFRHSLHVYFKGHVMTLEGLWVLSPLGSARTNTVTARTATRFAGELVSLSFT